LNSAPDVVLIQGRTEDQKGLRVLRARADRLELGEVRPLEQGKPILGDVVKLEPRPGLPFVCDVKTEFRHPEAAQDTAPRRRHPGPAQVSSDAYRSNWDAIWSQRRSSEEPN